MKPKKYPQALTLIIFLLPFTSSFGQEWTQPVKISTIDDYNDK